MLYPTDSAQHCDARTCILGTIGAGVVWLTLGALIFTNQFGDDPVNPVNGSSSSSTATSNDGTGIAFMTMGGLCLLPFVAFGTIFGVAVLREKFKNNNVLIAEETVPLIISTGESHVSRSNSPTLFHAIADKRIETVEKQRQFEDALQPLDSAVFLTSDMLTPLFIDPSTVELDDQSKLFKLKQGAVLPEGLMTDAKANDPTELSTVLGRTLSMRKMLDQGVSIIVMTLNENRKQVSSEKMLDDQEIQKIKSRYPHFQHRVIVLPDGLLKAYDNICAATYFRENAAFGIRVSQIHKNNLPNTSCIENPDTTALQALLESNGIDFRSPVAAQNRECAYA